MAVDETESCSSRAVDLSPTHARQQRHKLEVFNEVLTRLKDSGRGEVHLPGFEDELWAHFSRLPTRYALDVNVERAEDVLMHRRLLQLAHDPGNRPAFDVRLVQVAPANDRNQVLSYQSHAVNGNGQCSSGFNGRQNHPPPAFGSSPNLEALALDANKQMGEAGDGSVNANGSIRPMHEITFSTDDKPKLLSQLTSLLGEIGLNIQEAHAFSTFDGYSLDVFVVDGWPYEEKAAYVHGTTKSRILHFPKGSNYVSEERFFLSKDTS